MNKERLERIGKFLNYRIIVHRNVENDTNWTTEEKMIQELYDSYLDLLIKYKKQKKIIDKAIEYCDNNKEFAPRLEDALDILKEVSE